MENWSKKDEEKLFACVNGGLNWYDASRVLSGRFSSTSCRLKYSQRQSKKWNDEDDARLWRSRHLFPLRTGEVSERLRRPTHCCVQRLDELEKLKKQRESGTFDNDETEDNSLSSSASHQDFSKVDLDEGLLLAARVNDVELAQALLTKGAKVHYQDKKRRTSLDYATSKKMVQLLQDHGAKRNSASSAAATSEDK